MTCAPSEDSDHPGHPPSLIRVFAVRMKKAWVLSYPMSAHGRLWSDWADAQSDLSLRWAHIILLVLSWGGSFWNLTLLWRRNGVNLTTKLRDVLYNQCTPNSREKFLFSPTWVRKHGRDKNFYFKQNSRISLSLRYARNNSLYFSRGFTFQPCFK